MQLGDVRLTQPRTRVLRGGGFGEGGGGLIGGDGGGGRGGGGEGLAAAHGAAGSKLDASMLESLLMPGTDRIPRTSVRN